MQLQFLLTIIVGLVVYIYVNDKRNISKRVDALENDSNRKRINR